MHGVIGEWKDIDSVELFAGDARLSAALAELGLRVASVLLAKCWVVLSVFFELNWGRDGVGVVYVYSQMHVVQSYFECVT